jgi:arylsulfatase A-like enzyme
VFRAFWFKDPEISGSYYDYWLKGTGRPRWHGQSERDYSTRVSATLAARFLRRSDPDQPVFLLWTPFAPHLPATPARRDLGSWSARSSYDNRAVNERDMSDKQRAFQRLPMMDLSLLSWIRDQTMESLRAVDRGVQRILTALGPQRLHDTLLIFASDQGYLWGEHRMATKYLPYRWASDYPLIMRWDGHIPAGAHSRRLVPMVDVTATILEAAHASLGRIEGRSVLSSPRRRVVLEGSHSHVENTYPTVVHSAYCGVRTRRYMYVDWSGGRRAELYDYRVDPLELHNRVDDPRYRELRATLHHWAVVLCHRPPPDFEW